MFSVVDAQQASLSASSQNKHPHWNVDCLMFIHRFYTTTATNCWLLRGRHSMPNRKDYKSFEVQNISNEFQIF